MCNNVLRQPIVLREREIPEEGRGWKVFGVGRDSGNLITLISGHNYWGENRIIIPNVGEYSSYLKWYPENEKAGFCFFRNEQIAINASKMLTESYSENVVKEIHYKGGLQERWEENMFTGIVIRIALCKQFKINKER